jgi:hypothetical protein
MTRRQGTKPFSSLLKVKCYRAGQTSSVTGHHTHTGSGDHPPSYPMGKGGLHGMNCSEHKYDFALDVDLVPRLRMLNNLPPLPHTSS